MKKKFKDILLTSGVLVLGIPIGIFIFAVYIAVYAFIIMALGIVKFVEGREELMRKK